MLLVLILISGLTITQLALLNYTEGWVWMTMHGILIVVSGLAMFVILVKAVRWAVFPFNTKLITSGHHQDLNMRLTLEMVRLLKGLTKLLVTQM